MSGPLIANERIWRIKGRMSSGGIQTRVDRRSVTDLIVSTLAMADATAKLLIEKGVFTEAEFKQKLMDEGAVYHRILNPTPH